jgi:hypothetical protein
MPRTTTNQASAADWSSRVDPLVERYRSLVPCIGQEDAALAMSAVARMILAVEKARAAGSHAALAMAEDSILQAGKLLESVGGKSQRDEPRKEP